MSTGPDRWQRLNAYVDGELDPQAKAEIAAEIARDRQLAAAAATLTRLKAAATEAFADMPAIRIGTTPARTMRRAAAAVTSMAAVAAAVAMIWLSAAPSVPANLNLAVDRHAGWVASGSPAPAEPLAAPLLVGLAPLGQSVELPDLGESGLQIVRIAALDESGAVGLHVAYLGSRGCRVSLIVLKAGPGHEPLRLELGGMEIARWIADDLTYTLLASGMPKERFALIAASAEESVRQHRPVPEPVREALRRERDGSAPCAG